jgi:hypothetical protein
LGDPGVDGRIILKRIFRKWDMGASPESSWLRKGTDGGQCFYEQRNFIKGAWERL